MLGYKPGHEDVLLSTKLLTVGRELSRLLNLSFIRVQDPSPIARLSAEILGEIFMWSLSTNGFRSLYERGCLQLEPLTLSHVNSRWRAVALSTPSMWATIWVDRPRAAHLPMVEMWIERSWQCPLIIYLRQSPPLSPGSQLPSFADPSEFDLTDEILLLLGNELHRWKRVTFLFHKQTQHPLLSLSGTPTAAPLLEHVHMSVKTWDVASSLAAERIMYSYASVQSVVVHEAMSQGFVRWGHLTVLDAAMLAFPRDNCLDILGHCPSLRRAELRCAQDQGAAPLVIPRHRVVLPHLTSLTLYADRVALAPLMCGILLPKLEGLVLRYAHPPRRLRDPHALGHLLATSACVLQRFSLKDSPTPPDDAHHLAFLALPQMAALTELYLQLDLTDRLVQFLTLGADPDDGRARILPRLHTLSLKAADGPHVDELELYRMVVSRLPVSRPENNGGYSGALRRAYFHLSVKGHSASPVLPLLVERCRERIELRFYLAECDDMEHRPGWYTSPPIPGGYLTDV
ncbi:hypothetical protein B0H15DRAFT_837186 [Mycena belliarum]|uniref:F-box domain-containing protein n=1 Tax=Mycena belliarum TaxID=1033014 RepID=A0AAD6U5N9_9AGAR|nr:hypothetical protein B0H15DRAFT_837186 [Mycena belliae]